MGLTDGERDVLREQERDARETEEGMATELEGRVRELEESLAWWKSHADALDKNWEGLKDLYLNTIREALNMPGATVPEMAEAIYTLRANAN